jgi:predicted anti-sigma-YlaC factor YlaD
VSSDPKRLVLVTVGALAVVGTLVTISNQGFDVEGCTAATPLGWLIPIASVAVIACAAWLLLRNSSNGPGSSDDFVSVDCQSCGRRVLTDWRMCPYCGIALAPDPATQHGTSGD